MCMIPTGKFCFILYVQLLFAGLSAFAGNPGIKILNTSGSTLLPPLQPLNVPVVVTWSLQSTDDIRYQKAVFATNKNFFGKKFEVDGKAVKGGQGISFTASFLPSKMRKWYVKVQVRVKSRVYNSKVYSVNVTESLIKQLEKLKGIYSPYGKAEPQAATWILSQYYGNIITRDMKAAPRLRLFPVFSFYALLDIKNPDAYKKWLTKEAETLGKFRNPCVVVLEPDRFASDPKNDAILDWAVETIKIKAPNAAVFLDIGHSSWIPLDEIVRRVKKYRSYRMIDGFASNTSNFRPMRDEERFAAQLYKVTGKPVIIDTSRNGLSSATGKTPSTVHNPPRSEWKPGARFSFHPDKPYLLFNYHNKPYHEKD